MGNTKRCESCGAADGAGGRALMRCSACAKSYYCSRTCQHSEWASHKGICRERQRAQVQAISAAIETTIAAGADAKSIPREGASTNNDGSGSPGEVPGGAGGKDKLREDMPLVISTKSRQTGLADHKPICLERVAVAETNRCATSQSNEMMAGAPAYVPGTLFTSVVNWIGECAARVKSPLSLIGRGVVWFVIFCAAAACIAAGVVVFSTACLAIVQHVEGKREFERAMNTYNKAMVQSIHDEWLNTINTGYFRCRDTNGDEYYCHPWDAFVDDSWIFEHSSGDQLELFSANVSGEEMLKFYMSYLTPGKWIGCAHEIDESDIYLERRDAPCLNSLKAALSAPGIDDEELANVVWGFSGVVKASNFPLAQEIVESGLIYKFAQMLQHDVNPAIQDAAAVLFANVACVEGEGNADARASVLPFLVQLLSSPRSTLRERSALSLRHIAEDASATTNNLLLLFRASRASSTTSCSLSALRSL